MSNDRVAISLNNTLAYFTLENISDNLLMYILTNAVHKPCILGNKLNDRGSKIELYFQLFVEKHVL